MSYKILQFNCGTDRAQGYVLAGLGPHEGTNHSLTALDMEILVNMARRQAREFGAKTRGFTLLLDDPERADGPEVGRIVAQKLDYLFQRAHGERLAQGMETRQGGDAVAAPGEA